MAAAQNLELTLDMVVKNQGDIAKLIKQVGNLEREMKKLQSAAAQMQGPMQQVIPKAKGAGNAIDAVSKSARQNRQAMQMAGMQVGDFATQISTGSNPVQAFNQQIGQLGYALTTSATPALQRIGGVLAGPWSIAVLGATMLLGKLWDGFSETEEVVVDVTSALDYAKLSAEQLTEANNLLTESNEDFQRESKQTVGALAAIAKGNLDSAKASLQAAEAELARRSVFSEMGTTPGAAVIGADRDMNLGALQARVDKLKTSLDKSGTAFRGAQANLLEYNATTSEAAKLQDTLTQSLIQAKESYAAGAMTLEQYNESKNALTSTFKPLIEAAERQNRATTRGSSATGGAERAERRRIKALDQMNASLRAAAKYQEEFNERIQEGLDYGKEKPKTYEQVLGDLKKIETLQIETPKPLQDILDMTKEIDREFQQSFESIGMAVSSAFQGMLSGARSWQDGMRGIIQAVIDELWRLYVVQQIVGLISSALGGLGATGSNVRTGGFNPLQGRATGGSVSANTPYMVGEKGPELFMPGGSGTIIPNHNMNKGGGGQTLNITVDARGSNDPEAVRRQVEQGIMEAAPSIVAAAQNRTINTLRRPRLAGTL